MYCDEGLPPQDLAQSPFVAGFAGQTDRLIEVSASDLSVEGSGATARGQGPDQQTGVTDLSCDRESPLGVLHVLWGTHRCGEHCDDRRAPARKSRASHPQGAWMGQIALH